MAGILSPACTITVTIADDNVFGHSSWTAPSLFHAWRTVRSASWLNPG
ncbi:hypothetical protein ACH41H_38230 [Streptomyces sp. NPDC020800]